jgi:ABC-type lipopolysaccharide export system ATPase subunit
LLAGSNAARVARRTPAGGLISSCLAEGGDSCGFVRRRAANSVGRALTNPRAVLLDEPSAGLAVGIVRACRRGQRIRDTGVAVLLVEQNPRRVVARRRVY